MNNNLFENIFWIGGSSCAGKSSCAKKISEAYGLTLYRTDERAFGEHMFGIQDEKAFPAIIKYRNRILAGIDDFMEQKTSDLVLDFLAYCREVFRLILEDIKKLPTERKILIEGAHILPELIQALVPENQSIFLISTRMQQKSIYIKEMLSQIPGGHPGEIENYTKSSHKKLIVKKRVEFHECIACYIRETACKCNQKVFISRITTKEKETEQAVLRHFKF